MGRKGKFTQMDIEKVKDEVLNMNLGKASDEIAVGFESLNENTEDMIQEVMEETLMAKSERENTWDSGKRDGIVVENEEDTKPAFGSLSEKTKLESDEDNQMSTGEFNESRNDVIDQKSEIEAKREARKLKKELKERLAKLNNTEDASFTFSDVSCTMRDGQPYKYHLSLSAMQLAELSLSSPPKIYYDESIQRGVKHTASKGDIPIINKKHSEAILKACLEGNINGGCIYLNYAKEYKDELVYDSEERTLLGNGALAINDGAHRIDCCKTWYLKFKKDPLSIKNPNDFYFPVTIENLDHETCKNVFVELNSFGLSVSKTRIAFHDIFNPKNTIAQKVMNNSMLRGKIELISNSLKKTGTAVMTFGTLLKGCSLFEPVTKSEINEIGIYLCEYWDEIIENFPKIYGNVTPEIRQEEKVKTFVGEVMFINALFALAVSLKKVKDWKERLKRLKQDDFLNRNNPIWSFCLREGDKLINSSKVQKDITKLFIEKVIG